MTTNTPGYCDICGTHSNKHDVYCPALDGKYLMYSAWMTKCNRIPLTRMQWWEQVVMRKRTVEGSK